ncbi:DUF721 domain-containing protein [Calidifontibacter sp. DB0510]|uniref:DUF721 domain-containing protein n=1 Tax=Metallococcus carri TaxID=1656884 RepID=A0A967B2I2_9MICO|nr:DUF721 domain-containing protein [Metallococcus carri]NOP38754.1 DUF721 domain-containing protein [Calidifontibacter sp. DB2511S]
MERDPLEAVREAVARARQAARDKGLRPGARPRKTSAKTPRTGGRPREDTRDPGLVGDQVQRLFADRGWTADVAAGSVLARWPEIVGAQVAEHARAVSFEEGVLVVQAESTAWATQLSLMTSTVLGQIEQVVGKDVVLELRIVGPRAPSWSKGPRKVWGGRGPRDTYG